MVDIATALSGLEDVVVHRDLKPENVLFYDGSWCLTDFGIASYAEARTAPDTRKGFLSAQYAAPEQWNFEHATGTEFDREPECAAVAGMTFDPDFTAHQLGQLSADRQPQAGPAEFSRRRAIGLREGPK